MNEIRTIYDNTFVLGQTSATNFVGGPGISITQPSEGTIRISNDETVLFENANGSQLPITVSELLSNFEYIRIEWCPYTEVSNWTEPLDVITTKVKNNLIHLVGWGMANDQAAQVETNIIIDCSTVNLTVFKIGTITSLGTRTTTSNLNGYKIYKVVGINRISGGNA